MSESSNLTISDALRDPLIAMVMRADGVKLEELKQLLETAARKRESKPGHFINGGARERAQRTPAPSHQREDMMHIIASRPHLADLVLLLGRLLLSLIFLHEGLSLATSLSATLAGFSKLGLPMPVTLAVIALQLGAGLSIAAGLLTGLGATALALFCLATALLFHTNLSNQNELLHFEKDLAIAGGMFVLARSGAGSLSIDRLIANRSKALPAWLAGLH